MKEGTKVKIGTRVRIMLPSGDIHVLSSRTGKVLKLLLKYRKGEWYNASGNLAKFSPKDKRVLTRKLAALKSKKAPTRKVVPKKPKLVPKKPKTAPTKVKKALKKIKPKAPSTKVRIEELKGMTKLKMGNQFLCTYKNFTFFLRKATPAQGKGWVIVEELKDGNQKGMPGVFKTPDSAMLYFKKIKDVSEDELKRIKEQKGGRVLEKLEWAEGERIVYDDRGAFRIGTVTKTFKDWMTGKASRLLVTFDGDDMQLDIMTNDPRILGKGIAKQNKEPISPADIDKWIKKEAKKKREYSFVLAPNVDLPIAIEDHWKKFVTKVFKFIKDPVFRKMVQEYMLDHPLKIIEADPSTGLMGRYWSRLNEVSINWKHIVRPDDKAAMVLTHEIIHYKTYPVKSKIKAWLKKEIFKILDLNPHDPKIKNWAGKFFADTINPRKGPLSARRTAKLLEKFRGLDQKFLYGLTNYFEVPSTYLSLTATGTKIEDEYLAELAEMTYQKFEQQLKK